MNFCPFPHSLRDQAWLAVGLGCGVLLMRKLRMKEAPGRALKSSEQLKGVETGGIGWEVPFKDGTMDLEDVLLPEGSIKDVRVCNCAVVFGRVTRMYKGGEWVWAVTSHDEQSTCPSKHVAFLQ